MIERKKKELLKLRKMVRDFSEIRLLLIQPFFDELKEKRSYFKTPLKKIGPKKKNSEMVHEEDKENISRQTIPIPNRVALISSLEIAKQTPTKFPRRLENAIKPLRVNLKPLTQRRINKEQRIQLLKKFFK